MTSSVFTVLTGQEWPLDIVKAQTSKAETNYSFLAIVYGIVADVDIESEKYRYMGDFRFTVLALKKIMEKKVFSGKLWYLPADSDDSSDGNTTQLDDGATKRMGCGKQRNLEDVKLEDGNLKDGNLGDGHLGDGHLTDGPINGENLSNGISDCAVLDKSKSELPCHNESVKISNPINEQRNDGNVNDGKLGEGNLEDGKLHNGILSDGILGNGTLANGTLSNGACNNFLPSFHEPVPQSWKVIEGDFVCWLFVSTSHIGKDAICAPEKTFGNGIIYCICLNNEMTRPDLVNVLAKMETGDLVSVHGVSMLKARAFRIEPCAAPSKIFTIDGERFEWGRLQAEVCRGLGRVRCRGPAEPTSGGE